ncbi:myb-like protein X [Macrobrachium rosenbergii]|uniref:myb-like protein X n=1 Tax=Macrobrachium rosenbergii TaxID=79674 RepID=UPI0034D5E747
MIMELADGKRTRKPISYAVLDCSDDDDFSEYTPPVKKKKDEKDRSDKSSSLSDKSKADDKDKCDGSQESSSDHGKDKDREKRRDKERDEKRRDRDKDKRDRDRDKRDKDRDKHRKKDKHRDKDRSRESRDKSSSEEERRKHRKDKKHDKKDKEREDKEKENRRKAEEENDSDFKDSVSSPKPNSRSLTTTQKSPGRTPPKKRLTVEERMFQRELEAALAISKIETSESADKQDLPGKEGVADIAGKNASSENPSVEDIHRSPGVNKVDSEDTKDISKEGEKNEVQGAAADNTVSSGEEKMNEENRTATTEDNNMPERSANTAYETEEPQPSTSTGMTSKRQRKKVVFFEESDSESFDGFDQCEMSEESDFAPSPVKKKGRNAKEPRKAKLPKPPKGSVKEQNVTRSPVKSPGRPRSTAKQSVKENTIPVANGASSPRVVSSTVAKPPEIRSPVGKTVIKPTARTPEVKQAQKTKTVVRTNTPSRVVDASKACTVKVPFRSPVQSSSTATPNFVPKSPNPLQRIGVRLGLSRTNFKPLHPKATAK